MEPIIQRMASFATRTAGQFTVVSVRPPRLSEAERRWLGEYAALVHRENGEFVSLHGRNVAATLAGYLRKTLNTEVVLGRTRRRWRPWRTTSTLIRLLEDIDVHILRRDQPAPVTKAPVTPTSGS
jgi:K+-sensing histidine kinase KdpD